MSYASSGATRDPKDQNYSYAVPEAIRGNQNEYISLEISGPYVKKQREFLSHDPVLADQTSAINGDLRKLPLIAGSADLRDG